ncbi:hypothetical protein TNCV_1876971 [Trichonephila clavipes]|nr:hypothetical protein TNCV_1876971 [Trichonephila clavipes]
MGLLTAQCDASSSTSVSEYAVQQTLFDMGPHSKVQLTLHMISIIRLRHRLTFEREKNNIYQKMELFTGGNNYPSSLRHAALAHLIALRRESWASLPLDSGVKK